MLRSDEYGVIKADYDRISRVHFEKSYAVERLLERGHAVRALANREDDRSKRLTDEY
jgi:hypothetical protein